MTYQLVVTPARRSTTSTLQVRLAMVDYRLVGTFEHTNPARVLASLRHMLMSDVKAPAISVVECRTDAIYLALPNAKPTPITLPDYGHIGIADGHHRLETIRLLDTLGILKSPQIPVQLLPMREPGIIKIVTSEVGDMPLDPDEKPLTISDIEACFPDPGRTIPPILTAHFEVRFQDGSYDWVRFGQPDIRIRRPDFLNEQYPLDRLAQVISTRGFQPTTSMARHQLQQIVGELSDLVRETPK